MCSFVQVGRPEGKRTPPRGERRGTPVGGAQVETEREPGQHVESERYFPSHERTRAKTTKDFGATRR
jgi:hypothetical protein